MDDIDRVFARFKDDKPEPAMGKVGGGAVRLAPIGTHGVIGLCEGIETGLAVMAACPGLPVWATLSTSGLEQVQLPPEARRIVILADHDTSGAGMRAADALAGRLRRNGIVTAIALPPQQGDDFNDMLCRTGPKALANLVDAALRGAASPPPPAEDETGRHLPLGFLEPTTALPVLRADEGNLRRATDRAWSAILASNRTPWLFRLGGLPSWVTPDDEGRPVAATVSEERLRHMLAKLADWRKVNAKGDAIPAPPPTGVVKSLLATPDPGLPILAGIVTTPVFGRGGVLLTEPGYHPDARLLYRPSAGFRLPSIPDRPSAQDIAAARSLLLDDLLGDFPFTSTAERAHALALLLLSFLRAMIDGPTPLHLIEKPTPGTGATLMVDVIATVLTGVGASVMTEGRDDEEWRKRLTAKLRQIPSLILIDNLREQLDSSALAAALTAPFWEDRILGQSDMTRLPIRCAWVATGNNPTFSNEMARRLVRIRLDAHTDQPWRRDSFRHPDLMVWVRANRGRLVAACLTLCHQDHPLSETTMAPATLTMPAAHASGPPIALPPSISLAHHAVLALDLGTTTGWALRSRDGGITSGTMTFRPSRFEGGGMRFLRFRGWLAEIAALSGGVTRIVFEEVRAHAGTDAAHIYGGFLGTLTAWCEEREVPYEGVPVGTIKRYATGRGNADKAKMVAAIEARGFAPADDNEADAIALLLWATEPAGGRA